MLSGLIADAFGALDDSGNVLSSLMGSDGGSSPDGSETGVVGWLAEYNSSSLKKVGNGTLKHPTTRI